MNQPQNAMVYTIMNMCSHIDSCPMNQHILYIRVTVEVKVKVRVMCFVLGRELVLGLQ